MDGSQTLFNSADKKMLDSLRQTGQVRRLAEEKIFQDYSYLIQQAAHKYGLTKDEAFDAYSDTILSVFQTIRNGSFEERSSLKTWLSRIFHNKCVDLVRKKTTNKNNVHQTEGLSDMLTGLSDATKTILQRLIDKADTDRLKQLLDQVGNNCRQMLMLSAEGYTDQQIAHETDYKTAEVVKTSRLRCLEKLRKLFKNA